MLNILTGSVLLKNIQNLPPPLPSHRKNETFAKEITKIKFDSELEIRFDALPITLEMGKERVVMLHDY